MADIGISETEKRGSDFSYTDRVAEKWCTVSSRADVYYPIPEIKYCPGANEIGVDTIGCCNLSAPPSIGERKPLGTVQDAFGESRYFDLS